VIRCVLSLQCSERTQPVAVVPRCRVAGDWTRVEVEAIVSDYFAMLVAELRGEPVNKAARNRALQQLLTGRSRGAIEFKHANISAVMIERGYPYIEGYKPRGNYQDLLADVVVERLSEHAEIATTAAAAVARPVGSAPVAGTLQRVDAPEPLERTTRLYERRTRSAVVVDPATYLEREARNSSLGAAGEHLVMAHEHRRLWETGARALADRVEHVARTRGDGLGYDVLSFEPDGRERFIEVKTTRFGIMTPFFATANEVRRSSELASQYHVYRLFAFDRGPKFYVLPGALSASFNLEPTVYRATLLRAEG
jgi:hypothetical protein